MLPSLCSRSFRVASKSFASSKISPVNKGFSTEATFKDNLKVASQYFEKIKHDSSPTEIEDFFKNKPEVVESMTYLNDNKEQFIKSNVLLDYIYNIPITKRKAPVRVAVTGAAGAIGYSLIFRIASGELFGKDQPVHLCLLELPQAINALKGVVMELEDCAFPLLSGITASSFAEEAFEGAQYAFLVGASPRKAGQERSDLLKANAQIFQIQGKALDKAADKKLKVLVVGNPANTNALIAAHNAPSLDPTSFSAMTRLDHNRGLAQLADKLKVSVNDIKDFAIWGNHSSTQYPDISFTKINGKAVKGQVDDNWVRNEFIPTVQQRGAAIIKARGASSAASAASSAIDHMRDWQLGTNAQWTSMAIYTPQPSYGASKDLYFSFPVVCEGGNYKVVDGLKLDEFSVQKIKETNKELESERDAVKEFLKKQ